LKAEYARLLLLYSTLLSVHTLPKITQTKLSYRPTLIFTEITVSAREGAGPFKKKKKNAKTQEPEKEKEKHRREEEKGQPKDYLPVSVWVSTTQGEKEQ
jgi:hypothetical protein